MSLTTLNHPLPTRDLAGAAREAVWRTTWRTVRQAVWQAIWWAWLGLHVASVGLARLINWFADDPRRLRVAGSGIAVSAAVGAAFGVGLGWVLAQLVVLAIDVVWAAQG